MLLYLLHTVVLGHDWQIYYCVALLKHLKQGILAGTRNGDLISYLNDFSQLGPDLEGFHANLEMFDFMVQIAEKYQSLIIAC
ncbi:hypothetical protein HDU84_005557 [Entophlyctis sp. JEL0112]|nr:hypothetical protein HDU84_005557 [Entophlyctis sp. JEL0112]